MTKKGKSNANVANGTVIETLVILSADLVQVVAKVYDSLFFIRLYVLLGLLFILLVSCLNNLLMCICGSAQREFNFQLMILLVILLVTMW